MCIQGSIIVLEFPNDPITDLFVGSKHHHTALRALMMLHLIRNKVCLFVVKVRLYPTPMYHIIRNTRIPYAVYKGANFIWSFITVS